HIRALLRVRQAEAERDKALERMRRHIERLPLAYLAFDTDLRITDWNPAAEQLFGFRRAEILGPDPLELLAPPPARPHVDQGGRRAARTWTRSSAASGAATCTPTASTRTAPATAAPSSASGSTPR